ncbi:ATP-dependent DNA helicase RecG [Cnuella takakiae]|uniref:ATP-dependent DNA helicase RecG n=1 Tax=Cnuella takakiae TaxID=1302690 RepID=UPI000932A057|nr:ATP-dependent DNA helicase RecG [Cnuella takakiae]OLY93733.1 ATP-dependent DNA helicase RecG [Cnuella takakiae]
MLSHPIEYLKGVGPQRAELLKKELGLFTFNDLLHHFPYRHLDRTRIHRIVELNPSVEFAQVKGRLLSYEIIGEKSAKRLVAQLRDETGIIELTWFKGLTWVQKSLYEGSTYVVFGKLGFFMGKPQMVHPEIEAGATEAVPVKNFLEPIYSTTEKLKSRGLGGRQIATLSVGLFNLISERDLPENLPDDLIQHYRFPPRFEAYRQVHFPTSTEKYEGAIRRLKFEELFIAQLRLAMLRQQRHSYSRGVIFDKVGDHFLDFYNKHLPFQLTGAQKRVLKEIRQDTATGHQMNRLLQGDVGSGKTIVALLSMLLAADNGYQACLMAPTEILAQQHFAAISALLKEMSIGVALLTGSTKTAARKKLLPQLADGSISLLVGTHALIEEVVQFKSLGLVVIDEQHRFGVAQRARLWKKAVVPPHVLVMTATPIPRTLAMTAYGDLDYSVMDELPPGRQPITTVHRYDDHRVSVMDFIRTEIDKGRQAYIIFPLIEESAKLDYENLMEGYEHVKAFFPEPKFWISMVHGRQPADQKEWNMQRFVTGDTQIMVSTTVIEVGVNVPNASVMVIENAEKFGLSQLHQLRGRVGRGAEKSYCILMTGPKLSNDARERIKTMVATNNGFEIAEKDLEIRGPGDIEGTRQSGALNLKLADLLKDKAILEAAREAAERIVSTDAELEAPENIRLKQYLMSLKGKTVWSKIS